MQKQWEDNASKQSTAVHESRISKYGTKEPHDTLAIYHV